MRYLLSCLALVAALYAAPPAWGESTSSDPMTLALSGQYDLAVDLAAAQDDADGYTIAASAIIAKILTLKSDDIKDDAKLARDYAETALELDPDNAEALLQYAVAYGIVTRASSNFTVWRKKMPQKLLTAIRAAQAANPDDARVDALLGSWHLGIIRKAGEARGADMFGADETAGMAAFEQAIARAPEDIVINMNYALSVLALDPDRYAEPGQALLSAVTGKPVNSDIERVYQGWALELLNIFENTEALQARAAYYLDGE